MDLYNFLKENKIEGPVTFVCHSFGTRIATTFAAAFPEKVHALCSIESVMFDPDRMRDAPHIFKWWHPKKALEIVKESKKLASSKEAFKYLRETISKID